MILRGQSVHAVLGENGLASVLRSGRGAETRLLYDERGNVTSIADTVVDFGVESQFGQKETAIGENARILDIGDANLDGIVDVLIQSPFLQLWLGNGDGTFRHSDTLAIGVRSATFGKADSDGLPDILVWADGQVMVLEVNLSGNFEETFTFSVPDAEGRGDLHFGDVTGDGITDVVRTQVRMNNGQSSYDVLTYSFEGFREPEGAGTSFIDGRFVSNMDSGRT